jgi:ABC-type nitrate/sulfonate/bicarbonate transport system substrate-binding protein
MQAHRNAGSRSNIEGQPMVAAVRRNKFDRRAVLKALFGAPLSSLPAMTVMRSAHAQAALQPIRMGIQIFTGAVATVWCEKKIYEKRGLLVEARQFADGRSVRDAMVADQLNAGTMNITPFIVGAAVSSLTMVGVVSLGGDTVGVLAKKGAGINSVSDLRGRRINRCDPNATLQNF